MLTCAILCYNINIWKYRDVWCWLEHIRMWYGNMWNVDMWECEMLTCGMLTCENVRCQHVRLWEYTMSIFNGFVNVCPEVNIPWIWEHALCDVNFTRFLIRTHADVNIENACCVRPDVGYAWMHMHHVWLDVGYAYTCMSRCLLVNAHCLCMNVEYARTQYDVNNWEWEWCWL